jgi:hypothetical protein
MADADCQDLGVRENHQLQIAEPPRAIWFGGLPTVGDPICTFRWNRDLFLGPPTKAGCRNRCDFAAKLAILQVLGHRAIKMKRQRGDGVIEFS